VGNVSQLRALDFSGPRPNTLAELVELAEIDGPELEVAELELA